MRSYLAHHGILGMRWGVRRTPSQLGRKDDRWVKKKSAKITAKAKQQTSKALAKYRADLMRTPGALNKNGKLSSAAISAYNNKMASLMNDRVSGLTSPSGKVVQFVAKRGEIGVFMALADQGYNMTQLKNGIYGSGRLAYKKTVVTKVG